MMQQRRTNLRLLFDLNQYPIAHFPQREMLTPADLSAFLRVSVQVGYEMLQEGDILSRRIHT